MKYIVQERIWSNQHKRVFEVGEEIEFAPNPAPAEGETLPPGTVIVDVPLLVNMGAITPKPEPEATAEAKEDPKKKVGK